MHRSGATLLVASLIAIIAASAAPAMPTQVNVRIEGHSETLFEGPIWTDGHDVEASSDTQERSCDGINVNDPQNLAPGPTPTTASVDAMSLIGETFDGQWYGGYGDYFITRWGPDQEKDGMSWGILVNNVFTNVGGCQYELGMGDEALWAYNAFGGKPFLALFAADGGYRSGPRPLTATAELGEPFEVEVVDYSDDEEDIPPPAPERTGSAPFVGADVSPVKTSAKGFEKIEIESPETVKTNVNGKASITFTEPGWHRIKATAIDGGGEEDAIRSNRLDVCVPATGASGCGAAPAEDRVRTPRSVEEEREGEAEAGQAEAAKHHEEEVKREEEARSNAETAGKSEATTSKVTGSLMGSGGTVAGVARIQGPTLNGEGAARGLVGVSWRVPEPGVGLRSWTIASLTLGARDFVNRISGSANVTSASLKLSPGFAYELQITFTDTLGRSSTTRIGKVLVPRDDRWSGLDYRGRWRRIEQPGVWLDTLTRGGAGTQVSARIPAGRPVFMLRATSTTAKIEVLTGSRREVFAIAKGISGVLRQTTAADRSRASVVTLRVLKGTVDLDGVAVEP